ncbi:hypothetical protein K501DRAFT_275326 [Backusella circina FSU 941]|nr:hypothetical protein K501DRAFT_275326 [Backusella circina FSU 941]
MRKKVYSFTVKIYPDALIKYSCISCHSNFDTKCAYRAHVSQYHIFGNKSLQWWPKFLRNPPLNRVAIVVGVLALQKRTEYGSLSISLFSARLLESMRLHLLTTLYKCEPFNNKILPNVNTILNNYVKGDIIDGIARIELLQLCEK